MTAPDVPALDAAGLVKRFGALQVTDGVDLRLAAGARAALIGPNGAGKTTLVNLLSGVLAPDAGTVRLAGVDVTRLPPERRVRGGLVRTFQITSLFAGFTVLENVCLALIQHRGRSYALWRGARHHTDVLQRAESLIDDLRLADDRHRPVGAISYGRQRLVEIGIALALEPKVLLLDEPAAGIPSVERDLVLTAVAGLPKDIAVLMIEHDMEMVRRFATEVIVLVQGRVLTSGPPDAVMSDPDVRSVYLGSAATQRDATAVVGA